MPARWKSLAAADESREYLGLLSYLPLKRFRMIPRFLKYTLEIERQLGQSRGLIGYSLQAQILSRKFWTLSVWEDDKALMEFVRRAPHSEAMAALASHMGATNFIRWKVIGSAVPPSWRDAKERMVKS